MQLVHFQLKVAAHIVYWFEACQLQKSIGAAQILHVITYGCFSFGAERRAGRVGDLQLGEQLVGLL